jgi:PPP family 3-phenylpropionic acid transporter
MGLAGRSAGTARRRLSLAEAAGLLRSRTFLIFLAAAGLAQAAHAVFYTFGTLHWRDLGLSTGWSGTLWAISIMAEVALFAWSAAVVRRIGPVELIVLGSGAAVIRWFAMGLDPPLALLVPLQLLHALTFGATHIGAIHFIGRAVPETRAGTAQALYASVTGGIAMGGAMLLAGPLYAAYAGRAYWAMAVIAALALIAGLALLRAGPHALQITGDSR